RQIAEQAEWIVNIGDVPAEAFFDSLKITPLCNLVSRIGACQGTGKGVVVGGFELGQELLKVLGRCSFSAVAIKRQHQLFVGRTNSPQANVDHGLHSGFTFKELGKEQPVKVRDSPGRVS